MKKAQNKPMFIGNNPPPLNPQFPFVPQMMGPNMFPNQMPMMPTMLPPPNIMHNVQMQGQSQMGNNNRGGFPRQGQQNHYNPHHGQSHHGQPHHGQPHQNFNPQFQQNPRNN